MIPSVIVKGRQGIWRLLFVKYNCKEEEIVSEMNGDLIEQPERQNFFLTELCSGKHNQIRTFCHVQKLNRRNHLSQGRVGYQGRCSL